MRAPRRDGVYCPPPRGSSTTISLKSGGRIPVCPQDDRWATPPHCSEQGKRRTECFCLLPRQTSFGANSFALLRLIAAAPLSGLLGRKTGEDVRPAAGADVSSFVSAPPIVVTDILLQPLPGPEHVVRLLVPGIRQQPRGQAQAKVPARQGPRRPLQADGVAAVGDHGACQFTSFVGVSIPYALGGATRLTRCEEFPERVGEGSYCLTSAPIPSFTAGQFSSATSRSSRG
jgi:hypothetical protein